jgi:hypothetical protein
LSILFLTAVTDAVTDNTTINLDDYSAETTSEGKIDAIAEDLITNDSDIGTYIEVTATDATGETITVPAEDINFVAGSVVLTFPLRDAVPGTYTVSGEILNPITGETEQFSQDFTWGVLTMNTDRDIYPSGATATIAIGVLDDAGAPVCSATAVLTITTPNGTPVDVPVSNTGECAQFSSANTNPDYAANYVFNQAGQYTLDLTVDNGSGPKSLTQFVTVADAPAFTTERLAATRLYPVGSSQSTVTITFNTDFNGRLTEIAPEVFNVSGTSATYYTTETVEEPAPAAEVSTDESTEPTTETSFFGSIIEAVTDAVTNATEAVANVFVTKEVSSTLPTVLSNNSGLTTITVSDITAKAGDRIVLTYTYDAPDVSPMYYSLGPVTATSTDETVAYTESRVWGIANDNPINVDDTNLKVWFRADKDIFSDTGLATPITTTGTAIAGWKDQTVNEVNVTQGTLGNRPIWRDGNTSAAINFHPTAEFSSANSSYMPSAVAADTVFVPSQPFTSFVVYKPISINTTHDAFISSSGESPMVGAFNGAAYIYDGSSSPTGPTTSNTLTVGLPQIVTHEWTTTGTNSGFTTRLDGGTQASDVTLDNTPDTNVFTISNNGDAPDGYISEIITYKETLSTQNRNLIESYLAMKYGITLPMTNGSTGTDFITKSQNGTVLSVFDASNSVDIGANSSGNINTATFDDYVYDVAGVMKDNTNLLVNTKATSGSTDDSLVIELENTSLLDNQEYLFWGNNNDAVNYTTSDLPTGLPTYTTSRIAREWRVQKTSIVSNALSANPAMGTVKMTFDLDDYSIRPTSSTNFCLVTDTDSNFTTTGGQTQYCAGTLNTTLNTLEFTGVSLTDGMYFMLAVPQIAPGGVKSSLRFWTRADMATFGDAEGLSSVTGIGSDAWESGAAVTGPASSFGQSFTATDTTTINSILFFNGGTMTTGLPFTVSICNGDVALNGEAACVSSPAYTESGLTSSGTGVSTTATVFKWTTPFAITAGSQYTIIITLNDSTNLNLLYANNTGTYTGGKGFGTGAWGDNASDDFTFGIGGYTVANWEDLSSYNNDATQAGSTQISPKYRSASSTFAINNNPALDFEGVDDYLTLDGMQNDIVTGDKFVMYAVFNNDDTASTIPANSLFAINRSSSGNNNTLLISANATGVGVSGADSGVSDQTIGGLVSPAFSGTHMAGIYLVGDIAATADDNRVYIDGKKTPFSTQTTNTLAQTTPLNGTDRYSIGQEWDASASDFFNGRIAEVLVYKANLVDADRNKVESYLALKYGMTLNQTTAQDYTASNGTTEMWDKDQASAVTYDNNIAGIGRDDLSGLNQTKSKSVNATAITSIEAETAMQDNEFLTWASDGDTTLAWTGTGAPAGYTVLDGKWMSQENSTDVGTVKITVDVADTDNNVPNITGPDGKLYFVYDTDLDSLLSDETPVQMYDDGTNGDATASDNIWTKSGINLGDGTLFTFSQKALIAPGGVSTNIFSWYKAEDILTTSNVNPTQGAQCTTNCTWYDASGNDRNGVSSGNLAYQTYNGAGTAINYNPAIDMDGGNDIFTLPTGAVPLNNTTYFARAVFVADTTTNRKVISGGTQTADDMWSFGLNGSAKVFDSWQINDSAGATTVVTTKPYIGGVRYDAGASTDRYIYLDGKVDFSEAEASLRTTASSATNYIGQSADGSEDFDGRIAEIIVYSAASGATNTEAEIQKIDSYLAIKYGITLSGDNNGDTVLGSAPNGNGINEGDYVLSTGAVVWDYSARTGYLSDVFGIARDDAGALAQVKSRSMEADGIVTVEAESEGNNVTASFADIADLEALMIGNDNEDANAIPAGSAIFVDQNDNSVDDAPTGYQVLNRTWLASQTGDVGTVSISVDSNDVDFDLPELFGADGNLYLVIDTDGDGNMNDETPVVMTNSSGVWTRTGVQFTAGANRAFTFAQQLAPAPGGVFTELRGWYKADAGVYDDLACTVLLSGTEDTDVNCWADMSGYGNDMGNTGAPDYRLPTVTPAETINYYPALYFNAANSDDLYTTLLNDDFNSGDPFVVYGVHNASVSGNDFLFSVDGNTTGVNEDAFDVYMNTTTLISRRSQSSGYSAAQTTSGVHITGAYVVGDTALDNRLYYDGAILPWTANQTTTISFDASNNDRYTIGQNYFGASSAFDSEADHMTGPIPEIIVYKQELSESDRQKVESYLAIKYGKTLATGASTGDFVDSAGTVLWDGNTGGADVTYQNSVIGVGRDDASGLDQIKSISSTVTALTGNVISLEGEGSNGAGTFVDVADREFLFTGADAGLVTTWGTSGTGGTATGYQRVNKTWKVRETGEVGTVTLARGWSTTATITSAEGYPYIAVDTDADGDFTDGIGTGTDLYRLYDDGTNGDATANDGIWTRSGLDLNNNQLFTFVQKTPPTPGGVSTNLKTWVRADVATYEDASAVDPTEDGDALQYWLDRSGNNINPNQTGAAANRPTYRSSSNTANAFNYNANITWDGGDSMGFTDNLAVGGTADFTAIVPFISTSNGADRALIGPDSGVAATFEFMQRSSNAVANSLAFNRRGTNVSQGTTAVGLGSATTSFATIKKELGGTYTLYRNGNQEDSDVSATAITATNLSIGESGDASFFIGSIPEVIVYNQALSNTDRQKVGSYISLKYGITLDQTTPRDYLASDGVTEMWDKDATGASTFNSDIFGIGRDDGSDLVQVKSKSMNSDGIITIEAEGEGSNSGDVSSLVDIANLEFLTVGNDNEDTTIGTWLDQNDNGFDDAPSGYQVQNRTWQVQETIGEVGTIELSIDTNDADYNIANITGVDGKFYFIRDVGGDGNMSNETPVQMYDDGTNGDDVANDGIYTLSGVDLEAGEEFTFAQQAPVTPGAVTDTMGFWYKADTGAYSNATCTTASVTNGSTVNCLKDYSSNGTDLTLATSDPAYTTNGLNGFPVINFDSGDLIKTSGNIANSTFMGNIGLGTNTTTILGVYNTNAGVVAFNYGPDAVSAQRITIERTQDIFKNAVGATKTVASTTTAAIDGFMFNDAATTSFISLQNAKYNGTSNTPTFASAASYPISLGGLATNTNFLTGDIAEFFAFQTALDDLEMQKVNSYLAMKYGITLTNDNDGAIPEETLSVGVNEGDYVLADGTTVVWDSTTNASFFNDIFGVVRDDAQNLGVVSSTSNETDSIVSVTANSEGTNTAPVYADMTDKEALFIGNDNALTTDWYDTGAAFEDAPSGYLVQARTWKVQKTGDVGPVTLSFNIDDVDFNINEITGMDGNLYFVRDVANNGTFSDETPVLMTNAGSGIWTVTLTDLVDGQEFTIAQQTPAAPGGVSDQIKFWVRADKGVYGDQNNNSLATGIGHETVSTGAAVTGPTQSFGQSFTATLNTTIRSIVFYQNGAIAAAPFNVYICNGEAVSAAACISSPAYSETGLTSISDTTSGHPYTYMWTTPFTITTGSQYTIIIQHTNATTVNLLYANNAGTYTGGKGYSSTAAAWGDNASDDFAFGIGGYSVYSWDDKSGNNIDAKNTVQSQNGLPKFINANDTSAINYNPTINFDGGDYFTLIPLNLDPSSNDPKDIYIVYSQPTTATTAQDLLGNDDGSGFDTYIGPGEIAGNGADVTTHSTLADVTTKPVLLNPYLLHTTVNGSNTYVDGKATGAFTYANANGGVTTFQIGAVGNTVGIWDGNISEIIIFKDTPTSLERQRISSYLAMKYGINITNDNDGDTVVNELISGSVKEGDYVLSDGTTEVWGYDVNTGFTNDVFGIVRDDGSDLDQVKSRSMEADGIVTIEAEGEGANSAPTYVDIADKEAVFIGNDNDASVVWTDSGLSDFSDAPAGYFVQPRTWKTQATGTVGSVKISVDVDDTDFNIQDILGADGNLYFIRDVDGDGDMSDETPVVMTNEGSGVWSVSGITLADAEEFTFAQQVPVYPGGVSTGIKFWTKADRGAYGDLNAASPSTGVGFETTADGASLNQESFGQSFRATATTTFNSINFRQNGGPYPAVPFNVYICNGDFPLDGEGACMSSPDYTETGLTSTPQAVSSGMYQFKWTTPFAITKGSQYTVIIEKTSATNINLLYNNATTNQYTDGKAFGTGIWGNNGYETFAFGIGGYEVMLWDDMSGNNADAKNTSGNYNTFANFIDENSASAINYNPAIDFNGSANTYTLIPLDLDPDVTDPKDIYVVYKSDTVSTTARKLLGNEDGAFDTFVGPGTITGTGAHVTSHAAVADVTTKAVLLNTFLDDPTAGASFTNVDGAATGVFQYSAATGGVATFQLGARGDNSDYFDGRIAETIIYNANTSSTDRSKIQSYLAIKYGISISQSSPTDYLASNGTTQPWDKDATGAITFDNDITVIGRDDLSGLEQVKSKSQNADGVVTIEIEGEGSNSNATWVDVADYEFLAIANDDEDSSVGTWVDSGTSDFDDAPSGYQIQNRTWQAQENNGDVGTVELSVDVQDVDYDFANITGSDNTLYFIRDVDADGNMSDETPVAMYDDGTNGDDVANDNIWTISGVNFVAGEEFSFTQKAPVTPGGVSDALGFWYKANDGIFTDATCNTPITANGAAGCWKDYSPNGFNLDYKVNDPQYLAGGLNSNPMVMFDGSDALGSSNNGSDVPNSAIMSNVGLVTNTMSVLGVYSSVNDNPMFAWGSPSVDSEAVSLERTNNVWENGTSATKSTPVGGILAIDGFVFNDSGTISYTLLRNGTTNGSSDTPNFVDAANYELSVGSGNAYNSFAAGPAAEMIGFKTALSVANRQRVESYLAMKYGFQLSNDNDGDTVVNETTSGAVKEGDYVLSNGTTVVWDYALNTATYYNDVFGIVTDDNQLLDQTTSTSYNTDSLVTISAASSQDDQDALFIGNNNADATTWTSTGAPTGYQVIARNWKVQETGDVGTVTIKINSRNAITDLPNITSNNSKMYLVIDNDSNGVFTDETPTIIYDDGTNGDLVSGDGIYTATGVTLNNGYYFTVAQQTPKTPGQVSTGLRGWWKADEGVSGDQYGITTATTPIAVSDGWVRNIDGTTGDLYVAKQSFTATSTGSFQNVAFRANGNMSASYANIYICNGEVTLSTCQGSPTYSEAGIYVPATASTGDYQVNFTTPYPVTSGSVYTFVVEFLTVDNSSLNLLGFEGSNDGDHYTGGGAASSVGSAGGQSFGNQVSDDYSFIVGGSNVRRWNDLSGKNANVTTNL